ncbi:MAG: ATP-grasp domain-containing protein [Candidatus Odinarchaeota archaeon]
MKLYEHEAKRVFEQAGITVPKQFGVIHSVDELDGLELDFPVMVKAAVLIGGRGKAGGVRKAKTLEETREIVSGMLKLKIKDYNVETVFFEQAVEERGACYVGVTTDPKTFNNVLVVSAAGGVDIEEVARTRPEAIIRRELPDNDPRLPDSIASELADPLGQDLDLTAEQKDNLASIITKVYNTFQNIDARLCEINPVIITPDSVVAADAKIVLDDNGLYRQAKLLENLGITAKRHDIAEPTVNETRATESGFPYVDLFPPDFSREEDKLYVGLVSGGAGYGIFSIDEVANIGKRFFDGKVIPINFMDSGGGPPVDGVAEMFHLLMDHPLVDIVITSRFGGISSCDVFIRGLVKALRDRHGNNKRMIPVYGRMVGTDLPAAKKYWEKSKQETPEALALAEIVVGNERIMADVIKEGIERGFELKKEVSS